MISAVTSGTLVYIFASPSPTLITIIEDASEINVITSSYQWKFIKSSDRWDWTRLDFDEEGLYNVKWKIFYNDTSISPSSTFYEGTLGTKDYNSDTSGIPKKVWINYNSLGSVPEATNYFYFYEDYFVEELIIRNDQPSVAFEIHKVYLQDIDVRGLYIGTPEYLRVVSWIYQQRFSFNGTNGAVVGSDVPQFIFSNSTDRGIVIASFDPTWQIQHKIQYLTGNDPQFNSRIEFSNGDLNASDNYDYADNVTISGVSSLHMGEVFFQYTGNDINKAMKGWAECMALRYSTRPLKTGSNVYWGSWYAGGGGQYGINVTRDIIISNATYIKNNLLDDYGFDTVLIDASITDEMGDWGNYSVSRFPYGLKNLTDTIHNMAMKIGLWIAPYWVEQGGWINQSHPDSLARKKNGELIYSSIYVGGVQHDVYYLDPYDSWTKSRIQKINGWVSDWGFDFVKYDFIHGFITDIWRENATREMNIREILSTLTLNLSSSVILMTMSGGESKWYYNPAQLALFMDRWWLAGPDIWGSIDVIKYKYDVMCNLMPFIKYLNVTLDADSLGASDGSFDNYDIRKYYETYTTVSGGTLQLSEVWTEMNSTHLDWVKMHLPFLATKWDVVDWYGEMNSTLPPLVWRIKGPSTWADLGNSSQKLAIFNPTANTIQVRIKFGELGFSGNNLTFYDVYTGEDYGYHTTDFQVGMYANTTKILNILNWNPENVEVTITDMDAGNWIFSETSYYTFQAKYWDGDGYEDLDVMKIAFTDDQTWVNATYDGSEWALDSGGDVVNLKAGTATVVDENTLQVTFLIYFTQDVFDAENVDVYMYCQDISGAYDGWEIIASDYFNIYSLGGNVEYSSSGNAGPIEGGDWINIYAEENSWVKVSQTWRNLQLIEMLLALDPLGNDSITSTAMGGVWCGESTNNLEKHGYWYFGIDYRVGDTWVEGWYVRLELVRNDFTGGVGEPADHITVFNASWFYRGQFMKWDYVGAWYEGWGSESEKNVIRLNIKLWFNTANASSTVGGWVSPLYYTMVGSGHLFWGSYGPLLSFNPNSGYGGSGSSWSGPIGPSVDSFFFDNLYGSGSYGDSNNIVYAPQITMVKLWVKVERDGDVIEDPDLGPIRGWIYKISEAEKMDYTFGKEMVGVDTPPYFEPQKPDIQTWGFLSTLGNIFREITKTLGDIFGPAILAFWDTLVAFLDTIAGWLGFPNAFSTFLNLVTNFFTWFLTSIGYVVSLLTSIFTFLASVMTKILNTLVKAIDVWVSIIQKFFWVLNQGWGGAASLWDTLNLPVWITLFFILYPVYLLYLWEDAGFDAVLSHLKMLMDILSMLVHGFITVIQVTINVIGRIIEAIPVIE